MVEFKNRSGTTTALESVAILMCYFLPLLVFHRLLVLPRRPPPPLPLLLTTPHHTTLSHSNSHQTPHPPWSSVHLDVYQFLLYGVFSIWVLSVYSGVPFLHHSRLSLSPLRSLPISTGLLRSTPDTRAHKRPSFTPPSRQTPL